MDYRPETHSVTQSNRTLFSFLNLAQPPGQELAATAATGATITRARIIE